MADHFLFNSKKADSDRLDDTLVPLPPPVSVGYLTGREQDGKILVRLDNGVHVRARFVSSLTSETLLCEKNRGCQVLLVFERTAPELPIIIGLIAQPMENLIAFEHQTASIDSVETPDKEAVIDGKRVILEGNHEVVLRCGKASITLQRDGKIVLKGTQITSRAKGIQKIKGAAVRIN